MSPESEHPDSRHLRFDDREGWFVDENSDSIRDIAVSQAMLDFEDLGHDDAGYFDAVWEVSPVRSRLSPYAFGDESGLAVEFLELIRTFEPLSRIEVIDLATSIEAGIFAEEALEESNLERDSIRELRWIARTGRRSKAKLFNHNLRLVFNISRSYIGQGLALMDLIQVGALGLIRAIEKFDHNLGFAFSTYATWWVRQSITREVADQSRLIRVPVHAHDVYRKILRRRREYFAEHRTPISDALLANELEVNEKLIRFLTESFAEVISLNQTIGYDNFEIADVIFDSDYVYEEEQILEIQRKMLVDYALDGLSEREATILRLRYGTFDTEPQTLDYIGDQFGVTRERIRQLQVKALHNLGLLLEGLPPSWLGEVSLSPLPKTQNLLSLSALRVSDGKVPDVSIRAKTSLYARMEEMPKLTPLPEIERTPLDLLVRERGEAASSGDWQRYEELSLKIWELAHSENEPDENVTEDHVVTFSDFDSELFVEDTDLFQDDAL